MIVNWKIVIMSGVQSDSQGRYINKFIIPYDGHGFAYGFDQISNDHIKNAIRYVKDAELLDYERDFLIEFLKGRIKVDRHVEMENIES